MINFKHVKSNSIPPLEGVCNPLQLRKFCSTQQFFYWSSLQQTLVFIMVANPIPEYRIAFAKTKNPIVIAHTHRINWFFIIYSFEVQTRVKGISQPHLIRLPRLLLHIKRKAPINLPEFLRRQGFHAGASRPSLVTAISVVRPAR